MLPNIFLFFIPRSSTEKATESLSSENKDDRNKAAFVLVLDNHSNGHCPVVFVVVFILFSHPHHSGTVLWVLQHSKKPTSGT